MRLGNRKAQEPRMCGPTHSATANSNPRLGMARLAAQAGAVIHEDSPVHHIAHATRAGGKGRNPQTGEEITIKPSKQPRFRAGKQLKDSLN